MRQQQLQQQQQRFRQDCPRVGAAGRGPHSPCCPGQLHRQHAVATRAAAAEKVQQQDFAWRGSDEFDALGDRVDAPPLPLPSVRTRKRVVLVRHGQSTWNAEGRIQGSSDFSQLTPKGVSQALTTSDMLKDDAFDAVFVSPLRRAAETAGIITGTGREAASLPRGGATTLPALREVDLYSLQGLLKAEGKERFGDAFADWQRRAAEFTIDGHAPVRELWHRASLAWRDILGGGSSEQQGNGGSGSSSAAAAAAAGEAAGAAEGQAAGKAADGDGDWRCALVVAHNAVNQALIASALGLPPAYFRRLLQSNAATSVLDFQPGPTPTSPPRVTLDRLNQSPGRPYAPDAGGRPPCGRLVLVRHAATDADAKGLLLGSRDEPLSGLGSVQASKVAEFLLEMKVATIVTSPARRCLSTAQLIAQLQVEAARGAAPVAAGSAASKPPRVLVLPELRNLDVGLWEGQSARVVADRGGLPAAAAAAAASAAGPGLPPDRLGAADAPGGMEDLGEFWFRTGAAWAKLRDAVDHHGGANVVAVVHAATAAALVSHCLALGPEGLPLLRFDAAGVSIIDFPDGARDGLGVVRCLNYTAHLGRWAVPITRDDAADMVCGIDGCF